MTTMLTLLVLIGSLSIAVLSTCPNERRNTYTCIDIANDSICTVYRGNGSYLNYTSEVDLLFLESDIINYIKSNISNGRCRDYLMTAVCATIYPVCIENDTVQQLCSEQCEDILNDMCTQDASNVIEYINERRGDPTISFTINCSNSLNFAELYLESLVCYDDDCLSVSIVDDSVNNTSVSTDPPPTTMPTVPVPDMCVQLDSLANAACRRFNQASQNVIFDYATNEQFNGYIETLDGLEELLNTSDEEEVCRQAAGYVICNYVFIPCNLTTGNPRPICTLSCDYYFNVRCREIFEVILRFSTIIDYPFMNNCPNTLSHLEEFGFSLLSDNFADDCIDIAAIVQPGLDLTTIIGGGNSTSSEDGSSSNSAVVIVVVVVGSLLAIGVVAFLIVLFLIIRHRRKSNKYNAAHTEPSRVLYDQNDVRLINKEDFSNSPSEQVADGHTALTAGDLELLRKEFGDDFTELLLPGYQVNLIEVLGEGEFGRVFKGTWTHQNDGREITEEVAVKTIKNYNSLEKLKLFLRESAVMKNFHHPNVLQVLGISLETEDGLPYILLPYMANGDLRTFLKSKRPEALVVDQFPEDLGEDKLMMICYQIACGMNYLAEKKVVHRDLAARNCMVDDKINVRVADFGLARDVYTSDYYRQQNTGKIPVKWMAPETLNDRISNEKTDVWSYGITCWEIFSLGRTPYPTIPNHEIPEYVEAGNHPTKPQLCPDTMYSVMLNCWEVDAKKRLCFREIVAELSKVIDDGYHVLDNKKTASLDDPMSPSADDGYVNDDYVNPTSDANVTRTLSGDYVNPTPDANVTRTPNDDCVNPTPDANITRTPNGDYVNT